MVDYEEILKDKDLFWFEDFERKAYTQVVIYQVDKKVRQVLAIAKLYLKIRKVKIKKFGDDGVKKAKLLQMKALVKTGGAFVKPAKIEDVMGYEGKILTDQEIKQGLTQ